MYKKFYLTILTFTYSVSLLGMQDPLETIKQRKSFFIIPYVQKDSFNFPNIGIYGAPYVLQERLGRIKFDPRMIINAPNVIKQQIPERISDLSFNMIINAAGPKTYNMVFHEWAGTFQPKLFDIYVPMGIFEADGVQPAATASIPFNQMAAQRVWVHNGGKTTANSPDNARLAISPQKEISSFWSIALSDDKQHAVVTFHILANSNAAKQYIDNALKSDQTKTLRDFLQTLEKGIPTLQPPDQQTMSNALLTIKNILRPGQIEAPAHHPAPAENQLVENLQTLARQLQRLSGRLTT